MYFGDVDKQAFRSDSDLRFLRTSPKSGGKEPFFLGKEYKGFFALGDLVVCLQTEFDEDNGFEHKMGLPAITVEDGSYCLTDPFVLGIREEAGP